MFWRSLRGMLPHKEPRGKAALDRLKVFEGIPYPYDHKKRMVVPEALKVLRMKQHRNFCTLGDLAYQNGWNKKDLVETLEAKRKTRSTAFWTAKTKKLVARKKAYASADPKVNAELASHGF
jgi:large subunit ribosomal protein L13Ae